MALKRPLRLNKLGERQKKRREEVAARRTTLAWRTFGRLNNLSACESRRSKQHNARDKHVNA